MMVRVIDENVMSIVTLMPQKWHTLPHDLLSNTTMMSHLRHIHTMLIPHQCEINATVMTHYNQPSISV